MTCRGLPFSLTAALLRSTGSGGRAGRGDVAGRYRDNGRVQGGSAEEALLPDDAATQAHENSLVNASLRARLAVGARRARPTCRLLHALPRCRSRRHPRSTGSGRRPFQRPIERQLPRPTKADLHRH